MYVTLVDGKAVTHKSEVDGCLFTHVQWAKAIKSMNPTEIRSLYKSLTGKVVKRFASKDDAAKRIAKFISPTGNGKKSGPTVLPSRKKTVVKAKRETVYQDKPETKQVGIKTKTIHVLKHESKTFQKGSVREKCYDIIMELTDKSKSVSVKDYLAFTYSDGEIEDHTALACLKKLCQANQKVQTMELV